MPAWSKVDATTYLDPGRPRALTTAAPRPLTSHGWQTTATSGLPMGLWPFLCLISLPGEYLTSPPFSGLSPPALFLLSPPAVLSSLFRPTVTHTRMHYFDSLEMDPNSILHSWESESNVCGCGALSAFASFPHPKTLWHFYIPASSCLGDAHPLRLLK